MVVEFDYCNFMDVVYLFFFLNFGDRNRKIESDIDTYNQYILTNIYSSGWKISVKFEE